MTSARRLEKSDTDRMFSGVSGGIASYFDIDAVIVRLTWVVLCFLTAGLALLAYIALAIIMPREGRRKAAEGPPDAEPAADEEEDWSEDDEVSRRRGPFVFGLFLVVVGVLALLVNLGVFSWWRWDVLWPVVLIAIGALVVIGRVRGN